MELIFENDTVVNTILNEIQVVKQPEIKTIVESMFELLIQKSTVKNEDEIDILFKKIYENLEKKNEKGNLFIKNQVYKNYISGLLEDYKHQFEELKKLESLKLQKEKQININLNIIEIDSVRTNIVSSLKQIENQIIQYKKKPLPVFLGKPESIEIKKKEQETLDNDFDEQIFFSVNDNNGFTTSCLNNNLDLFIEKFVNDDTATQDRIEITKDTTTDLSNKSKDELITFIKNDKNLKKKIRSQMDTDKWKNYLKKYLKKEIADFVVGENKKYFDRNEKNFTNINLKLSDENIEKLINEEKAKKEKEAEEARIKAEEARIKAEREEKAKKDKDAEEARKKAMLEKTYTGIIESADGNKKIVNITTPKGETIQKIVDCNGNVCTVTEGQNIKKEVSTSENIVNPSVSENVVDPKFEKYQKMLKNGVPPGSVVNKMLMDRIANEDIQEFKKINSIAGGRRKTKKVKKVKKSRKQNKSKKINQKNKSKK